MRIKNNDASHHASLTNAGVSAPPRSQAPSSLWMHPHHEDFASAVEANPTGLQLTFLGTAAEHGGRRE